MHMKIVSISTIKIISIDLLTKGKIMNIWYFTLSDTWITPDTCHSLLSHPYIKLCFSLGPCSEYLLVLLVWDMAGLYLCNVLEPVAVRMAAPKMITKFRKLVNVLEPVIHLRSYTLCWSGNLKSKL